MTEGKGCNVVADPVGASNVVRNMASLAMDGRWVIYGWMGGKLVDKFDLGALVAKRGTLHTTTLKSRSDAYKTNLLQHLAKEFFHSGREYEPVL